MSHRLFSRDSMIWKIDREMILLLGGGRALLMQLAHPKVAAGVGNHSQFQEDPIGRLQRTMNTMWLIVFDEWDQAQTALRRVKEVHCRVEGTTRDGEALPSGTPYAARDPELLLWVHATLVDSAIRVYELLVHSLSREQKIEYYEETKRLAHLFDVPESLMPVSLEAFERYMSQMIGGGAISVGASARAMAQEILYPRPWVLKMGGPLFAFITAGLLPEKLRDGYGLAWNEPRERIFRLLTASLRTFHPLLPAPIRVVPQARAAEKRLGSKTF